MLIKIPSKFTDDNSYIYPDMYRDVYVNTDLISTIEVHKWKEDITDYSEVSKVSKDNPLEDVAPEYELKYSITILMNNQNFITCRYGMTDAEFQEFMTWFNKAFAKAGIENIRDDF